MDSGAESRRSARIPGRFWVAVEGVDAELMPRRGDISATGMFFEHDADIGEVGTVQWVHVASWDRTRAVQLMAYVVRAVTLADVQHEVRGVALEFMPESDDAAAELCDFVKYVLEHGGEPMAPRVSGRATAAQHETHVDVKNLSVQTLLLETDWALPVGEPVRVEIIARGVRKPIRVEGQAVSVLPSTAKGGKRFRIAVQVKNELEGPLRRFSSPEISAVDPAALAAKPKERDGGPLDTLLSALIEPKAEPPERHHLTGLLARIPFTSLCQLVELERLSGVLTIRKGTELVRILVREGRFVDVDTAAGPCAEPRAVLAGIFGSREGAFDFDVGPVDRANRIGAGMTELLLDLARESDEGSRGA
jgi:hypothetical protein